jgi:hypothetical protein
MPAANVNRRTAGEGSGHTARVYVSEESHCGIVPMNHSNKDGTSSAEHQVLSGTAEAHPEMIAHPDQPRACGVTDRGELKSRRATERSPRTSGANSARPEDRNQADKNKARAVVL